MGLVFVSSPCLHNYNFAQVVSSADFPALLDSFHDFTLYAASLHPKVVCEGVETTVLAGGQWGRSALLSSCLLTCCCANKRFSKLPITIRLQPTIAQRSSRSRSVHGECESGAIRLSFINADGSLLICFVPG